MGTVIPNDVYLNQVGDMTQKFVDIKHKYTDKWQRNMNNITNDPIYQYGTNPSNQLKDIVLSDNRINKLNYTGDSPSLADGIQSDINTVLLQENTMYIICSIAISSLIVMALIIAKD